MLTKVLIGLIMAFLSEVRFLSLRKYIATYNGQKMDGFASAVKDHKERIKSTGIQRNGL